ncbi:MAG: MATE family efflux transporter [Gemmatimonadota bacterium]|nr:MATE family efflux transporter [Gemmatimonadota bacterium]
MGGLPPALATDSLAALGMSIQAIIMVVVLLSGVSVGTTALVARMVGAGQRAEANTIARQSMVLAALFGLGFIVPVGVVIAPGLLRTLGATGQVLEIGVPFLRLSFVGMPLVAMNFVAAMALRGAGDTRTPLRVLLVANVFNIGISYMLIYGVGPFPRMNALGAAAGNMLAGLLSFILYQRALASGRHGLQIDWSERPVLTRGHTRRVLSIGAPTGFQYFMLNLSGVLVYRLVSATPDHTLAVAAYAIGVQVRNVAVWVAQSFGAAASAMVGQNLGAQQLDRAARAGWTATGSAVALLVGIALLIGFGAPTLVRLFNDDPTTVRIGADYLRTLALSFPALAVALTVAGALQGAGATKIPMVTNLFTQLVLAVPAAYYFGIVRGGGTSAIWWSLAASTVVYAALNAAAYAHGGWRYRPV